MRHVRDLMTNISETQQHIIKQKTALQTVIASTRVYLMTNISETHQRIVKQKIALQTVIASTRVYLIW